MNKKKCFGRFLMGVDHNKMNWRSKKSWSCAVIMFRLEWAENLFPLILLFYENFCPAIEICYHLPILLKIPIGAVNNSIQAIQRKPLFNRDLNRDSCVSSCSSSSHSPALPLWFLALFDKLGTFMREWGFRIRKKHR